jgi:membrane-bound lytic murein transglycosylase A
MRAWLGLGLSLGILIPAAVVAEQQRIVPLRLVIWETSSLPDWLGQDDRLWAGQGDRAALVRAIDHSLDYLKTPEAATAYQNYAVPGFTVDRVRRSLERFRHLVLTSRSAEALQAAVQREFVLYQSVGTDGEGAVHFTGYFEPVHQASRVPTAEFRYPLYRLPDDFRQWAKPHPSRAELEGADGLQGDRGKLRGLEIAWLRDRLEAYLVQVQGSARLQMTDGSTLSIGYAGRTDYPYVSIGRELIEAGKIAEADLTLDAVIAHFQQNPTDLDVYLPRNNRFIFFKETHGSPAIGSLRVPVTAGRSIATDKSLMPPGALALIQTELPDTTGNQRWISRFVLDQDTGGAIRGAGRVDLFVGTGAAAGDQAGLINHDGQLYYLLLKP